eukprot:CAMPEP_0198117054 /NCGR_PEP_ID=MMETSP1442-20131203/16236_1 /TAXON_ID= /ORGANISM="Craspedostauros australis, Strain CCMP3328" /LENGTH=97 /DNA_ID=CAMNT_0043775017 /DNA_START=301 /DNA_END=591 /DNA_ORIENTATION=+
MSQVQVQRAIEQIRHDEKMARRRDIADSNNNTEAQQEIECRDCLTRAIGNIGMTAKSVKSVKSPESTTIVAEIRASSLHFRQSTSTSRTYKYDKSNR